jgi:hypothetical protein
MDNNKLKGGKADKMSIEDIAKKHGVSIDAIKKEIQIGIEVEKEHTSSKGKEREIVMDHLVEDPEYYSNKKTGLIAKEKESEKRMEKLNEETKKLMALAGIQEGDKKYLTNESFSEPDSATLYPDGWKEMDGMFMGPNRITQEKLDAVTKMMEESKEEESDFIIMEFDQEDVEPGQNDDELYTLK